MTNRPPAQPAATPSGARRRAIGALKLALAVLLLAWLARSGRLDARAFALDARALRWLALAALLQGTMIVSMAARWKAWLQALPPGEGVDAAWARLSWREALVVTARGACLGAWTPAGLGLDGVRAAHALRRFRDAGSSNTQRPDAKQDAAKQDAAAGDDGHSGKAAGFKLLLKPLLRGGNGSGSGAGARAVGIASLLDRAVALAVLAVMSLPFLASRLGRPGAAMLIALLALGVPALATRRGRAAGLLRPRHALRATAWTALTHGANILALGAILEALAPSLDAWRAITLAIETGPIIILSNAIPLTPLGLGVADATGEALLARHGLNCGGEAVMLARAVWLGVCLLAGAAFWLRDAEDAVD